MRVVLIDYGAGNLHSAMSAFRRLAPDAVEVSADPASLDAATHIVLPGVGAFGDCMRGLQALPGMIQAMTRRVIDRKTPFLGICVGMQMLFDRGFEHGEHAGLGWIPGEVVPIPPAPDLKIPHMGWNELMLDQPSHPLLAGIAATDHAYFVHSFHAAAEDPSHVLAHVEHGVRLSAVVGRDHIVGTQFHPEKSQRTGERLLANFLAMR